MIDIVILAAGVSKRYEGRKLESLYKGKPLLQWVLDTVRKLNGRKVLVVSDHVGYERFNLTGFEVLRNSSPDDGLSSTLKIALKSCKGEGMLLFLGDMPEVDVTLALKVLRFGRRRITFPIHNNVKGFPVFLPASYFEEAMKISGDVGLRFLIKKHLNECLSFEYDLRCVYDVDTIQNLKR